MKKYSQSAIDLSDCLYGVLLRRKGKPASKVVTQLVTRILRHIHGKHFVVMPSKAAEELANEYGFSFIGKTYNQSYQAPLKAKISKEFHREHINNGCEFLSECMLNAMEQFNDEVDLLDWLYENTQVVLRLKSEAEAIHEHSMLEDIKELVILS